jgi:hypothetical protein
MMQKVKMGNANISKLSMANSLMINKQIKIQERQRSLETFISKNKNFY